MALNRQAAPVYAVSQGVLVLSTVPVGAESLKGKPLLAAGTIDVEGTYECEIATDGANVIEVEYKVSAVTGTITAYLRAMRANRASFRAADEDSGTISTTTDVLVLSDLRGQQVCKFVFTIGSGDDVTFAVGADPASPAAIAEYNCL